MSKLTWRPFYRFLADKSGAALVEGAIMFPLLVLLGFGAAEYSIYFYQSQLVTTGVRDAARFRARGGSEANAKKIAVYGTLANGASPRVPNWTVAMVDIDPPTSVVTSAAVADLRWNAACAGVDNVPLMYTARTTVPFSGFGIAAGIGVAIPTSIIARHTERCIGQ